ncbi:hypothetical protein [Nonomuraea angiospora]
MAAQLTTGAESARGIGTVVLGLAACVVAALTVGAVALPERQDLGGGMFHDRLGPADAVPGLRTPLALAWRLHRGELAGRVAGFALVGFALGSTAESLGEMMNNSTPAAREVLARIGGPRRAADAWNSSWPRRSTGCGGQKAT